MKQKLIEQLVKIEMMCVELRIANEFDKNLFLLKEAENHLREASQFVRTQIQSMPHIPNPE